MGSTLRLLAMFGLDVARSQTMNAVPDAVDAAIVVEHEATRRMHVVKVQVEVDAVLLAASKAVMRVAVADGVKREMKAMADAAVRATDEARAVVPGRSQAKALVAKRAAASLVANPAAVRAKVEVVHPVVAADVVLDRACYI